MICPVCGFENLTGAEVCDNCGADLAGQRRPAAGARRSTAGSSASTSTSSARRRR